MGEKRLVVHRAGGALPIVQIGFHTAAAADDSACDLHDAARGLSGSAQGAIIGNSPGSNGLVQKRWTT